MNTLEGGPWSREKRTERGIHSGSFKNGTRGARPSDITEFRAPDQDACATPRLLVDSKLAAGAERLEFKRGFRAVDQVGGR